MFAAQHRVCTVVVDNFAGELLGSNLVDGGIRELQGFFYVIRSVFSAHFWVHCTKVGECQSYAYTCRDPGPKIKLPRPTEENQDNARKPKKKSIRVVDICKALKQLKPDLPMKIVKRSTKDLGRWTSWVCYNVIKGPLEDKKSIPSWKLLDSAYKIQIVQKIETQGASRGIALSACADG